MGMGFPGLALVVHETLKHDLHNGHLSSSAAAAAI